MSGSRLDFGPPIRRWIADLIIDFHVADCIQSMTNGDRHDVLEQSRESNPH